MYTDKDGRVWINTGDIFMIDEKHIDKQHFREHIVCLENPLQLVVLPLQMKPQ